jgi:hypothetical protein
MAAVIAHRNRDRPLMAFSLGLGCVKHLGNVARFKHLTGLHECTP